MGGREATSSLGIAGSQRGPMSAPKPGPGLCTWARLAPAGRTPGPREAGGAVVGTPPLCSLFTAEESKARAGVSRPAPLGPQEPRQAATALTHPRPSGHSLTPRTPQQLWLQAPAAPWERVCPSALSPAPSSAPALTQQAFVGLVWGVLLLRYNSIQVYSSVGLRIFRG